MPTLRRTIVDRTLLRAHPSRPPARRSGRGLVTLAVTVALGAAGASCLLPDEPVTDEAALDEALRAARCTITPNPSLLGDHFTVSATDLRASTAMTLAISDAEGPRTQSVTTTATGALTASVLARTLGAGRVDVRGPRGRRTVTLASCTFSVVDSSGPACGNGIVDPGETCDGDCPTTCSDGSACTTDVLNGAAATCTASCTHTPITACAGGDGCCPSGCTHAADADCPEDPPPPTGPDCRNPASWPAAWASLEDQVLVLVNARRAAGATCNGVSYPPVGALLMDAHAREAARCHSLDMATQDYFSHTGLDGQSFSARLAEAGYTGSPRGENIAAGSLVGTASAVVTAWMGSRDGHCEAIMAAGSNETGIGYAYDAASTFGSYWTEVFGYRAPSSACGDGACTTGETCSSCPSDCGVCPPEVCGNGYCGAAEGCSTCSADCGVCTSTFAVVGATVTSATTVTLAFGGEAGSADDLTIQGTGGYGWGCGWWADETEASFYNLVPGATYRAFVTHADGSSAPAITFTMPSISAATDLPSTASSPSLTNIYYASGPALAVGASDVSGVARVEYFDGAASTPFATHQLAGTHLRVWHLGSAWCDAADRPYAYVETPATFWGTTRSVRARVTDRLGNATEFAGSVTFPPR